MQSNEANPFRATPLSNCQSYKPGHQVHWIQARVKRDEPRFDARVVVLDETSVQVSWLGQMLILHNHLASRIEAALNQKASDYVRYSPTSKLLYIQTELPNGIHRGAFSLFYLAESELAPCLFQAEVVSFWQPSPKTQNE